MKVVVMGKNVGILSVVEELQRKYKWDITVVIQEEKSLVESAKQLVKTSHVDLLITTEEMEELNQLGIPVLLLEIQLRKLLEKFGLQKLLILTSSQDKIEEIREEAEVMDENHLISIAAIPELNNLAKEGIFDPAIVIPFLEGCLAEYALNSYAALVFNDGIYQYYRDSFDPLFEDENVVFVDGYLDSLDNLDGAEYGSNALHWICDDAESKKKLLEKLKNLKKIRA